jgi:4-amino-4-deoxy-L-arabinose transferase-like glycosyltransferase
MKFDLPKAKRCAAWGLPAAVLAAGLFVLLFRLGDFPLKDWDEAIYAEITRELIRTGDPVQLYYNHTPYYNKPPLYFWLAQIPMRTLGFSEFSSRLPGSLFGLATLAGMIALGRRLHSTAAGCAAALLLLSSAMFLENGSRHATPDSLLVALGVWALWAKIRSRDEPVYRLALAALLALGFMAKSVAIAPLAAALLAMHFLDGDFRRWSKRDYRRALALMLVIVLPWYILMTLRDARDFWYYHLLWNVVKRATDPGTIAASHVREGSYYVTFLWNQLTYLWPILLLLAWWVIDRSAGRAWWKINGRFAGLLFLAAAFPVALFSLSTNKTWWYIVPSAPPIMMAAGLLIAETGKRAMASWWRTSLWVVVMGFLVFNAQRAGRSALEGQIRNGWNAFGNLSVLAKQVEAQAEAHGMKNPLVLYQQHSPTFWVYSPFEVVSLPDYYDQLKEGRFVLDPKYDGVLIIGPEWLLDELATNNPPATILVRQSRLALARMDIEPGGK